MTETSMSLAEVRAFGRSLSENADRMAAIKTHWLAGLLLYCQRVAQDERACSDEDVVMFWLRLWGLLAEYPAELAANRKTLEHVTGSDLEVLDAGLSDRAPRAYHRAMQAMAAIDTALNDDQRIYAEVRRHTECHMRQSALLVQMNGKFESVQTLKERSKVKTLANRELPVTDLHSAIRRVLESHNGEDRAIARDIASRIGRHVAELHAARLHLNGEQ